MATKIVDYFLNFGAKATIRKISSLIAYKIIPSRFFSSTGSISDKDKTKIRDLKIINSKDFSDDYKEYLDVQVTKSLNNTIYKNPAARFIMSRDKLIQSLRNVSLNWNINCKNILSVGSRDDRELDNIQAIFKKSKVTGLDLFSASKRIVTGDMHNMPFEDLKFDATLSIHNQEHAYDPKKSLGEIFRVTKKGGLIAIEVPVNFEPSATDRVDYKNLLNLITYFPEDSLEVLWSETFNRNDKDKANLRVIFKRK